MLVSAGEPTGKYRTRGISPVPQYLQDENVRNEQQSIRIDPHGCAWRMFFVRFVRFLISFFVILEVVGVGV